MHNVGIDISYSFFMYTETNGILNSKKMRKYVYICISYIHRIWNGNAPQTAPAIVVDGSITINNSTGLLLQVLELLLSTVVLDSTTH